MEAAKLQGVDEELSQARKLLKQLQAAVQLEGAVSARKMELIRKAIKAVRDAGAEKELQREMANASTLLSRLQKLEDQKKEVGDMS